MPNTSAYAARSISLFDTEIGVLVAREVNNVDGGEPAGFGHGRAAITGDVAVQLAAVAAR